MKTLLLLTAALLFPPGSRPDELRRERLPADVDFVVHLDFEGLQRTELWRHVKESSGAELEIEDFDEEFGEFKERFGLDPFTDVRAVTLYKMESEEDPTVALFSTTAKIDQALAAGQKEPGYARIREGGIELHTWQHHDDGQDETVCAYIHVLRGDERVAVLASNKESALRAARVLRGEQPNHAAGGSLLTLNPAPGSFLYLAAANISQLDEFSPASQVFGLAQGIQVDLGEAGGFLQAHMGVATDSPENARNVSDVVQGLIALGSLAGGELGPALELLRAVRLNTRGSLVTVDFSFGVQRLIEILETVHDGDEGDDGEEPR